MIFMDITEEKQTQVGPEKGPEGCPDPQGDHPNFGQLQIYQRSGRGLEQIGIIYP